jgi:hypothetical protein
VVRGSRWVDYDTHELLEMISELEDERRWARLREGLLDGHPLPSGAALRADLDSEVHLQGAAGHRSEPAINQHKDFTYLDSPPTHFARAAQGIVKPLPAASR